MQVDFERALKFAHAGAKIRRAGWGPLTISWHGSRFDYGAMLDYPWTQEDRVATDWEVIF